jgi:DNA-binding IscR family transcriptional regulator
VLSSLATAKLIGTKAGSSGGAWLARKPGKIRISEIYAAVEEPPGPGFRRKGNSSCPVGRAAPGVICGLIGAMRTASEAVLARQTLADLLKKLEAAV